MRTQSKEGSLDGGRPSPGFEEQREEVGRSAWSRGDFCVKCLPSGEESDPEGSVGERSPRECYTRHIPRGFKLSE